MGITKILRRIWLLYAKKIKSPPSFSKQRTQRRTQLIFAAITIVFWHNSYDFNQKILICKFKCVCYLILHRNCNLPLKYMVYLQPKWFMYTSANIVALQSMDFVRSYVKIAKVHKNDKEFSNISQRISTNRRYHECCLAFKTCFLQR